MFYSIIIPVYNVEIYLEKCVFSIIKQPFSDYEIILIDDGSTDSSGALCDDLASRFKNIKVIHKANGGLSSARNAGIKSAIGKYLLYLDSDDYMEEGSLLKLYKLLCDNTDMVIYNYKKVYGDHDEQICLDYTALENINISSTELIKKIISVKNFAWYAWAYITKREIVIKNKLFFTTETLYEDVDISFKYMLASSTIKVLNDPIINYRYKRPGSITSMVSEKTENDKLKIISKNISWTLANVYDETLKEALCNKFSEAYYNVLIMFYYLPREERHAVYASLKEKQWVCKYTRTPVYFLVYLSVKTIGIKNTSRLLYYRSKLKERDKKT